MTTPAELSLITSEHADKPNFVASVLASIQGVSDTSSVLATLPGLFDLDVAVGEQLDIDGQWIGQTRDLDIELDDTTYRALLYGTIGENQWDGSIPSAYAYLDEVFSPFKSSATAYWINNAGIVAQWKTASGQAATWVTNPISAVPLIQDYGNRTMAVAVRAGSLPETLIRLLLQGRLSPRPAGMRCYYLSPAAGAPIFGLDAENATVAGLDVGAMASIIGDSASQ